MDELLGKKILKIFVSDNQEILSFDTDKGLVSYKATGDCCSESWFADITGVDALLGATPSEIKYLELGEDIDDGRSRQDVDQIYGFKITTEKGYADIIFRNSSNGYYGGGLTNYYESLPEGMVEITDDWQA